VDVEPAQLGLTGSSSLDNKLALLGWLSKEAENTARFGSLVARDRSFWLASRRGGGRKAEVGEAGCWAGRALEPEMRMMTRLCRDRWCCGAPPAAAPMHHTDGGGAGVGCVSWEDGE